MHRLLVALLLLSPLAANAESALPFMKDMAGERELPPPWGIGFDFYTMDQDYNIDSLIFAVPGLPGVGVDPDGVKVDNEVQHYDIKADVWLLPFLNVFALVGHVKSDTVVDLSAANVVGIPLPPAFTISTDGTVLGGGATMAFGGERWFGALTVTYTDADLGGDFNSSAKTWTAQPRVGLIHNQWMAWVGGMYLDIEETHSGLFSLPIPEQGIVLPVEFDVVLGAKNDWNTALGVRHHFSRHSSLSLEIGFGDRSHTLFNYNYRF